MIAALSKQVAALNEKIEQQKILPPAEEENAPETIEIDAPLQKDQIMTSKLETANGHIKGPEPDPKMFASALKVDPAFLESVRKAFIEDISPYLEVESKEHPDVLLNQHEKPSVAKQIKAMKGYNPITKTYGCLYRYAAYAFYFNFLLFSFFIFFSFLFCYTCVRGNILQ